MAIEEPGVLWRDGVYFYAASNFALVNKNWTQKTKFFSDSILSLDSSVLFTILSWC